VAALTEAGAGRIVDSYGELDTTLRDLLDNPSQPAARATISNS
jgi:hypothetical protein